MGNIIQKHPKIEPEIQEKEEDSDSSNNSDQRETSMVRFSETSKKKSKDHLPKSSYA